jgi:hypothetical protein
MPDVMHWLGITRIDRFVSMSNMKHDAMVRQGIEITDRIAIPDALIPPDAKVEMDAKKAAGYYSEDDIPDASDLAAVKGRALGDYCSRDATWRHFKATPTQSRGCGRATRSDSAATW